MKGLYIHIPFCDHICIYCDFLKFIGKEELKNQYIDALCKEIKLKIENHSISDIDTIYIGGGTPSSLSISLLTKLLETLDIVYERNDIKEYTIEANPWDIVNKNTSLMEYLRKHHINRISLGVQTFDNKKLKRIYRNHDSKMAVQSVKICKEYFENVSIDLIYGFECDNYSLIKKDILKAKSLDVKHISCYSLILEDKSILKYKYDNKEFVAMDAEKESKLYYKIRDLLNDLGYTQYEVSNFSAEQYQSLHNMVYWKNGFYEACGIGAGSYIQKTLEDGTHEYHRIKNVTDVNQYIRTLSSGVIELKNIIKDDIIYEKEDRMNMEVYLRLRMRKGINISEFVRRFGIDIHTKYPNILVLLEKNILIETGHHITIHPDYIYVSDNVVNKIYG